MSQIYVYVFVSSVAVWGGGRGRKRHLFCYRWHQLLNSQLSFNRSDSMDEWMVNMHTQNYLFFVKHIVLDKRCDLEQGLCGWSNTQSHNLDKLDWELSNLLSETHYPTPPYDHTLHNERGVLKIFLRLALIKRLPSHPEKVCVLAPLLILPTLLR